MHYIVMLPLWPSQQDINFVWLANMTSDEKKKKKTGDKRQDASSFQRYFFMAQNTMDFCRTVSVTWNQMVFVVFFGSNRSWRQGIQEKKYKWQEEKYNNTYTLRSDTK